MVVALCLLSGAYGGGGVFDCDNSVWSVYYYEVSTRYERMVVVATLMAMEKILLGSIVTDNFEYCIQFSTIKSLTRAVLIFGSRKQADVDTSADF